jgi:hypothetical protein
MKFGSESHSFIKNEDIFGVWSFVPAF